MYGVVAEETDSLMISNMVISHILLTVHVDSDG